MLSKGKKIKAAAKWLGTVIVGVSLTSGLFADVLTTAETIAMRMSALEEPVILGALSRARVGANMVQAGGASFGVEAVALERIVATSIRQFGPVYRGLPTTGGAVAVQTAAWASLSSILDRNLTATISDAGVRRRVVARALAQLNMPAQVASMVDFATGSVGSNAQARAVVTGGVTGAPREFTVVRELPQPGPSDAYAGIRVTLARQRLTGDALRNEQLFASSVAFGHRLGLPVNYASAELTSCQSTFGNEAWGVFSRANLALNLNQAAYALGGERDFSRMRDLVSACLGASGTCEDLTISPGAPLRDGRITPAEQVGIDRAGWIGTDGHEPVRFSLIGGGSGAGMVSACTIGGQCPGYSPAYARLVQAGLCARTGG